MPILAELFEKKLSLEQPRQNSNDKDHALELWERMANNLNKIAANTAKKDDSRVSMAEVVKQPISIGHGALESSSLDQAVESLKTVVESGFQDIDRRLAMESDNVGVVAAVNDLKRQTMAMARAERSDRQREYARDAK